MTRFTIKLITTSILAMALLLSTAHAQEGFTVASIKGTYAFTITFGANYAGGLGTCTFDGAGNVACPWTANLPLGEAGPALDGTRMVIPVYAAGSYDINPDGTGTFAFSTGGPEDLLADLVITEVRTIGGVTVATKMFSITREPALPDNPGASMAIGNYSRISDNATLPSPPEQ